MTDAFRNRIVGHGTKRAADFLANPFNYRLHPRFQQDVIRESLNTLGWFDEVIENQRTGHVIDGHARVTQALRAGEDEQVPYVLVDMSEDEERLALMIKDPSAALAGVDAEQYAELLRLTEVEAESLRVLTSNLSSGAAGWTPGKDGDANAAPDQQTLTPPDEFKEYDENLPTNFRCPKCAYEWSGAPR